MVFLMAQMDGPWLLMAVGWIRNGGALQVYSGFLEKKIPGTWRNPKKWNGSEYSGPHFSQKVQ